MLSANSSRRVRRLPALTMALVIGGGSVLAAPVLAHGPGLTPIAAAQECSTPHHTLQGDITWGLKQSFLSYVKGPVAKGSWSSSGATDKGNSFGFSVTKGYVDGSHKGFAQGSGTVTFNGHGGLLKTVLSQPTVQFTGGTSAKLLLKISSQDPDGNPIKGLDGLVHFADITLSSPINGSGTVRGTTVLTSAGSKAMAGFYEAGTQLDDITLNVTATESCDALPTMDGSSSNSGGGGVTDKDRDLDTGFGGLDALNLLNEYLESGNDAVNNTSRFLDTLDKFAGRNGKESSTTTGGDTPSHPNSAPPAAKPGTTQLGATQSGASNTRSAAPRSAATPQATAEQCTAVNSSEIAWGIKKSFLTYITGSIAKGGFDGNGVSESGGTFLFSGTDGSVDPGQKVGSVNTSGSLHFYGHGGKLDLTIANLRATFNGNSGQLIADMKSSDVEGNKKDFGTVAIAELSYSSLNVSDSSVQGAAEVTLTSAGADAFAGFYEAGTQLDPLAIDASLGGNADCASANSSASGSSDGTAAGASGTAAALAASTKSHSKGDSKGGNSSGGFNENANGDVSFRSNGTPEDIEGVNSLSGTLSPAQLAALAAAFAIAAGACLTLTYRRKPQN